MGGCFDSFNSACQWGKISKSLEKTFVWLTVVHHRLRVPPPSESPAVLVQLAYLALLLGCIASYAAVVPARTVFTCAAPLALVGASIPELAYRWMWSAHIHRWVGAEDACGGAVYAGILFYWLFLTYRSRGRSRRRDIAATLLLLWPLFVIVFRLRLTVLEEYSFQTPFGVSHIAPELPPPLAYPCAAGALIALSGFLLSRYREQPWST